MLMLSLLLPAFASPGIGQASNDKDYLGNRNAPANVIFVIDLHDDTTTLNCFATADTTGPCINEIQGALQAVLPRENWARYGIAYTRSSPATADNFTPPATNYVGAFYGLEPDGNGTTQSLSNAIAALGLINADSVNFPKPNDIRNPAESVRKLWTTTLRSGTIGDGWTLSPTLHTCQDTHIVLITTGRPINSDSSSATLGTMNGAGSIRDVCCDAAGNFKSGSKTSNCTSGGGAPATDSECPLDNVARELWLGDSSMLAGTQKVRLHTIYLEDSSESALDRSIADALYANVQDVQSNTQSPPFDTSYIRLNEANAGTNSHDLERAIRDTLWFIRDRVMAEDNSSGFEDLLQAKVESRGKYAAVAWSSLVGDTTASHAENRDSGHMTFWTLDTDPTSATYGQFLTQLVLDVAANESVREESGLYPQNVPYPRLAGLLDMNRNVFTYMSSADSMLTGGAFTTWKNAARVPFDHDLELALTAETSAQLPSWVAGMLGPTGGTDPDQLDTDFDGDMDVDRNDFTNLIYFAHDWDSALYRWGYQGGSSTYDSFGDDRLPGFGGSIPAVVDYNSATEFSSEATYQTFLDLMAAQAYGAFAFIGANDGTLRAYLIENPGTWWTSASAGGYEVFRWIPEGVLARDPALLGNLFPSVPWHGAYVDQLIYGRQLLGGGSVTVRDVWIDSQNSSGSVGFGTKECTTIANCEWRRIAVLAREDGGGGILALDVTNPYSPTFLREYYGQSTDGMGTSRPVIANVYDDSHASTAEHEDRPVLFFGSGRPVDIRNAPNDGIRHSIEPAIHTFAITQTKPTDRAALTAISNVTSTLPDWNTSNSPSETTYDADANMEFAGSESPLAVLDTDADGDADTAYFTITKSFRESSDTAGLGVGSAPAYNNQQFPSTSLYKACRETAASPGQWTYLKIADLGVTEVYYAPTLSYFADGTLGLFVVTSTPYELDELDYTAMADSAGTQQRVYFGYDSDPDGCGGGTFTFTKRDTVTAGSCTSNQYVALGVGERVVSDPVVYGGYILFSTYTQATGVGTSAACSLGTGRIRIYNYETCAAPTITGSFSAGVAAVSGYPSNIAITDFGTVLAVATGSGATTNYAISLNVGLFESVKVLNWMQVF